MTGRKKVSGAVNRGIAWTGAAQTVFSVADVVSTVIVLGFWIGPADYGISSLAYVYFPFLDMAADLGVAASLIQKDDHTPAKVSTVFWINMLVSLALFGLLAAVGPILASVQRAPVVAALLLAYGAKLIFQNIYAIPLALMRKQLRFGEIAVIRATAHLAESASRIGFAMAGVTVWCFTLAALVRVAIFGVAIWVRNPFVPRLVFRPREVASYFTFGLRSSGSQLLYQLYVNGDVQVVNYFFGSAASGIYKVVVHDLVLSPVRLMTNVVADVAFPAFARLRHETGALVEQLISLSRVNLIVVLPYVALVFLAAPEIVEVLFPGHYLVGAPWARLLCTVAAFRALGFLGPPLLDGIGRAELNLRYTLVAAIAVTASFVAAGALFGERLGPASIATAWAVAYPFAFVVLGVLVVSVIPLPIGRYLRECGGIVACVAVGLGCGAVVRLLGAGLPVGLRLAAIAVALLAPTVLLFRYWQGISPAKIRAAMKD